MSTPNPRPAPIHPFAGSRDGDQSSPGRLPGGAGMLWKTCDHRPRVRSGARRSVERLVLRELSRVCAVPGPSPLTPRTLLADAGIDHVRLLDATCRIEGHYQMRFRDEWLREIRSVGDLIGCVVARMFDGLDAAVERARSGRVAPC